MSIQFGAGNLTVEGVAVARLMNLTCNISYDVAALRGGNLIFPTNQQFYNGNIEGSFEVGDINLTAVAAMFGVTGADIAYAVGSGTMKLTATTVLGTGRDIVCSCVTNGVTGVLTLKNCKFNTFGLTIDRENYTLPSTNFIVAGDANGLMLQWQI